MRNRRNHDKSGNNHHQRSARDKGPGVSPAPGGQRPPRGPGGGGKPGQRGHQKGASGNKPVIKSANAPSTLTEIPLRLPKGGKAAEVPTQRPKLPPRRYGVVFFDTLAAAKADLASLQDMARGVDQLNIVIRAEASMDDLELSAVGKVFAGAAWALIHDRRVTEGWYNEPH
jgi:hypothetical protein